MSKTIFITGGSGKIGFQIVKFYLETNYIVITTTRNKNSFINKCKSEKIFSESLFVIEVDFVQKDALIIIEDFLLNNSLKINCVIHNARNLDFLKIEEDGSVIKENFLGELSMAIVFPYELTLLLKKSNVGLENVIFISSIYGVVGPTPSLYNNFHHQSPIQYGTAKASQIHLVKELAIRLAPTVRVNCVSFGGVKGRVNDEFLNKYKSLNPQHTMLEDKDVVAPIDFLVKDSSKNMTGQNLIIDNGWTVW